LYPTVETLLGEKCAHALLLLGRGHGLCPESRLHQQLLPLRCHAGTDGCALARCDEAEQQHRQDKIRKSLI